MNSDQQRMWDMLSSNYARLSHLWGQEMTQLIQAKKRKKFLARANYYIGLVLNWPVEDRVRAVKTWLTFYKLPFEPDRLECFTQFHETTSDYILQNIKQIAVYEQTT
jgi:hypothetical protein